MLGSIVLVFIFLFIYIPPPPYTHTQKQSGNQMRSLVDMSVCTVFIIRVLCRALAAPRVLMLVLPPWVVAWPGVPVDSLPHPAHTDTFRVRT